MFQTFIGLLDELAHVNFRQLGTLETEGDPVLLLLVEGQDGTAHEAALEDAALDKGFLQAGMGLTGGLAAAVDGLGDVVDAVEMW